MDSEREKRLVEIEEDFLSQGWTPPDKQKLLLSQVRDLERELASVRENPQIGTCSICGITIWRKEGMIEEYGKSFHIRCKENKRIERETLEKVCVHIHDTLANEILAVVSSFHNRVYALIPKEAPEGNGPPCTTKEELDSGIIRDPRNGWAIKND